MTHSKKPPTSWKQRPDGVHSPVSDKPRFFKGEVVGSTKKYSDRLLMFLLEAYDPEMFRDGGKVEHPGAIDIGVDRDREKRIMERLESVS